LFVAGFILIAAAYFLIKQISLIGPARVIVHHLLLKEEQQTTGARMLSSSFLSEFQQVLPPETAQLVFKTLRREPLIWSSLQEEGFFLKVAGWAAENVASWSPAGLALLAMDQKFTSEDLSQKEMPALERNLRQHALHAYEEIEMMVGPVHAAEALAAGWRTPLACLYGMVPDPADMIANLVSSDERWPAFAIISHVLLTNQVDPAERRDQFVRAMSLISIEQQLDWLRQLQRMGEGDLAADLAQKLLEIQPIQTTASWTLNDKPAVSLSKAHDLAQLAGLHRFARQSDQAYALIEKAREATQRWMVGLNTQLTDMAIAAGKFEPDAPEMEELIGAVQKSALLQNELTLTLGKYAQAKSLVEKASEPAHPFAQILKAGVAAASGDREAAQGLARKAAARFLKDAANQPLEELSELIFEWQPEKLIQILFDLDLIGEARSLSEVLLDKRPNDLGLIGWLSVLFQKLGSLTEAVEAARTLRAGVLSAPESPELNFRLANACLETGSLSEALPFLKKAATLTPNELEVTLGLGNTLFCLGHLEEARQVLGTARQKWVSNPDLAFVYAQVLIANGEAEKAIPVFEVALMKDPPQFSWYLQYAETLLDDWEALMSGQKKIDFAHLVNAQQALEKALLLNPEDFQAHLLLAETLSAKGRPDAAIEIYQRLVETADSEAPAYCWRVQGGFGKVALQLGQIETALVALQEASCAESNNVFFQRLLAEAYLKADLKKEALQVARTSQRLAPNDLETLSWFAEIVLKMGEALEAVEALECATQLAPDDPDYWTRLAGLHMQIGNLDAARNAYETMTGLDLVQPDHLQQAAYGYLRMEDRPAALDCLQRAVDMSTAPSGDLLFETARLLLETDQPEAALDCLQKAIQRTPLDLKLHVFQSDLLVI
jgi:tetratricopeptide (TPR) repeat protein